MDLRESVARFVEERTSYYNQWVYDQPLVIDYEHGQKAFRLQQVMYKLVVHFVENYDEFRYLMPVSDKVQHLLKLCAQRPYKAGTYRTDFVYDQKGGMRLIEITCRFALNGMFLAAVMNEIALNYHRHDTTDYPVNNVYDRIYEHFETYLEGIERIYVLIGDDRRNESKIYQDIFERMGIELIKLPYYELEKHIDAMENAWIISELAFDEILSIPDHLMRRLTRLNVTNDFRTVFLIHDKRFFSVIGNPEFQSAALTPEEQAFFAQFYIETVTYGDKPGLWKEAKENREGWILKHSSLGKSQKVFAGPVTEEEVWKALFEEEMTRSMVLQRWIPQTTIQGVIGEQHYNDFVTGTLLFFDNNFFGFGDFRTSSFPVTNVVDHRKACSLILEKPIVENKEF